MNKSFLKSLIITGLMLGVVLSVVPMGAGAQMAYYYSGYNARPYWNKIPNMTVVQGQTLSSTVTAVDENGDQLTYSLIQAPQGAIYDNTTHVFKFTPDYNQLGSFPVTISATDGKSQPVVTTFYVNVSTDYGHYVYGGGDSYGYYNQAPYFTTTNSYYVASTGSALSFYVTAVDPEGQVVRYSVNGLPSGASFSSNSRQFSWTPAAGQRGTYTLTFTATGGQAVSIPFTVTIVVDGGLNNYGTYNPAPAYYPSQSVTPNYYAGCNTQQTVFPTTAVAGQTLIYNFLNCDVVGRPVTYNLLVGPTGASITGSVLTWAVPEHAVNQDYNFSISATNGLVSASQNFSIKVVGGTPVVTTVTNPPKNVVRYITAPASTEVSAVKPATGVTTVASYYPTVTAGQVVTVNAGRVVPPTNYAYYGATAYGAFAAMPAAAVDISTFNIAVRVNSDKQMVVSWDTNKPTKAEVVFGYSSQSRGPDLDRTILNYDFTTGEVPGMSTRHEANLGALNLNRTYYLRVISRADNQTSISREIVFIPMTTEEGKIIVNQSEGAASAIGVLGNFLLSGGFLFFLLLIVIGLIVYLIMISRRPVAAGMSSHEELPLHLIHDDEDSFRQNGRVDTNGTNGGNGHH